MYVHGFYRAGPVLGSAISGIDMALWDIRGKVLGKPVYELLGGPLDDRGVRGYYHLMSGGTRSLLPPDAPYRDQVAEVRRRAEKYGVTAFKTGIPGYYEWLDTHQRIKEAIDRLYVLREVLGDQIDIGIDFHAKTGPTVATVICREIEPLNCRELIEQRVVDILQTDSAHVGGISAQWKVASMAEASGIRMAPHACEGPIAGIATLHVDAAMPNFLVQEICSGVEPGPKEKLWEEFLGFPAMRMVNGYFPLPTKPGLGIEVDEDVLARYPFGGTKPFVILPLHEDGSIASP